MNANFDRHRFGLVVRREVTTRVRDKTMIISTLITVFFLVMLAVLPRVLDRPTKWTVGVVGTQAKETTERAKASVEDSDTQLRVRTFADSTAAKLALQDGKLSAVLLEDTKAVTVP